MACRADAGRVRVLLVEDDDTIASPLQRGLAREGFAVEWHSTGTAALERLRDGADPAVILLDLGLPDMDGFELCRSLRQTSDVPVIVVTARGDEVDRVVGLELGADDDVVKPFSARELVARIRAVLRRAEDRAPEPSDVLLVGDVRLDPARRTAAHQQLLPGHRTARPRRSRGRRPGRRTCHHDPRRVPHRGP